MLVRKIFLIALVIYLSLPLVYSQHTSSLHRRQFEQMGAWAVARYTAAYMADRSQYRPLSSLEKSGQKSFIAQFTTFEDYREDPHGKLDEAYNFLKDGANYWSGNGKDVFVEYKWNYIVALRDSVFTADAFSYQPMFLSKKGFTANREAAKAEIQAKFEALKNKVAEEQKVAIVDLNEGRIIDEDGTPDSLKIESLVVKSARKWPSSIRDVFLNIPIWVYWVVMFLLGMIIFILYYLLRKAKEAQERLDNKVQELIEFNPNKVKYTEIQEDLENENALLQSEIKELKAQVRKLKSDPEPGKE